tara:strand:+ start:430 stop:576 length:147 start_codon:yes stop_codon:yes gene_type:complete
MGHKEMMVLQDHKVLPVHREQQVHKVLKVQQETQALKVMTVLKVPMEL